MITVNKHRVLQDKSYKPADNMRLDKWLWCARFFKTRKQAADAVRNGRVREDGNRIKPARDITAGICLNIRKGSFTFTITVQSLAQTRLPAPEAEKLYSEHQDSIEARNKLALQLKSDRAGTPRPQGRPDKRERRKLIRFTRRQG